MAQNRAKINITLLVMTGFLVKVQDAFIWIKMIMSHLSRHVCCSYGLPCGQTPRGHRWRVGRHRRSRRSRHRLLCSWNRRGDAVAGTLRPAVNTSVTAFKSLQRVDKNKGNTFSRIVLKTYSLYPAEEILLSLFQKMLVMRM